MSIKKELLNELTEQQLKELAEHKSITFSLSTAQKKYYVGWDERDKLVDMISDHEDVTVTDVEDYIKFHKNQDTIP